MRSAPNLNLNALVLKVVAGEREAENELAEHLRFQMYIRFLSLGLNPADSEDLAQASVADAMASLQQFDPTLASVGTWTASIARNHLRNYYRKQVHRNRFEFLVAEVPDAPTPANQPFDSKVGFASTLAILSTFDRDILQLRYQAQLTCAEIAEKLGLTEVNVRKRISRAVKKLRDDSLKASSVA